MAGLGDYTGTFNDKLCEYLGDQGLSGTLNDKLADYTGLDALINEPNVGQKLQYIYINGVPVTPSGDSRITEDGNTRITEDGNTRITI